jgi:hypothetical protein
LGLLQQLRQLVVLVLLLAHDDLGDDHPIGAGPAQG